ncbi:TonB-dependent receptor [Sphingomonas flavalba]|uniref:TonB-dependent receptor n=1 Tax=Sphingomonas flavalba TaxID=2559804 RepID=UPI00109DE791|nr:TonB-dependent receptor [Sphingomonas flavalba]
MKMYYLCGVALAALTMPAAAGAQSTGSVDFDNEIVVTAITSRDVGGVVVPDTSKAKAVLTQEFIQRQVPGQTVNDIINQLPGVSFQNNDPFGSAGGKMFIRGFDNSRISQTFDGIPLNDSGNYALYSNQQLDPELIEQVNVNLGSTDVDSPTAAASGSTVNYRTRLPSEDFGVKLVGSAGDFSFFRIFGMVDTGTFTPWGTRAFFSASSATNDTVYGSGRINKKQFNGRLYQPIGSNGDFVSIAGHWNVNRNNFFGSVPLRLDADRVVGPNSSNRFPVTKDERFYEITPCQVDVAQPGVADTPNSCGTVFDNRFNPSDTGNIRISSRFTLADGLVLTVDPSYQSVKANGGGTVTGFEYAYINEPGSPTFNSRNPVTGPNGLFGYIGGKPYAGIDLNGDGDLLDQVSLLAPSQTRTKRYGVIASLRYDISDAHSVRLAYSYDRARHRQTGQVGYLQRDGKPVSVFPVDDPIADLNGHVLQKRDRLSYAILNQVSGEYRGRFFDGGLIVTAGLRMPFFKRDLNNFCSTTSDTGFVDCFGDNAADAAAYAAANPNFQGPQQRVLKYDKPLPNVGLTYNISSQVSLFGNYSKGLQVPGTDNLYNAFFFPANTPSARPVPESTDNFDLGVRYRSGRVQAQLSGWYTKYQNRLAAAYDPETDRTLYRNLGTVDKYGVDGSIAYSPVRDLTVYVFGSYLKSKIKDDVLVGEVGGVKTYLPTGGKRESGAPEYTFGGRIQGSLGPLELGVQAKRTGRRWVNDQNTPVYQTIGGVRTEVYGATAPAYTLVDIDARLPLGFLGLNDTTYLQFNVTNLFDKLYVGGFDGTMDNGKITNAQIGAPRTFIGTLVVGF